MDALWQKYGTMTLEEIPPAAQAAGCDCILDWLGVDQRATAKAAAMINGATGHALDFDDTNLVGGFHATSVVLPAALAAAEMRNASGADLLTAYIVGTELCCRLKVVIGDDHYRAG